MFREKQKVRESGSGVTGLIVERKKKKKNHKRQNSHSSCKASSKYACAKEAWLGRGLKADKEMMMVGYPKHIHGTQVTGGSPAAEDVGLTQSTLTQRF